MKRAFVDNDAVFKMAQCDLLDWSRITCGIPLRNVFVLGSLRYVAGISPSAKRSKGVEKFGQETFNRLDDFLKVVTEIDTEPVGLERFTAHPQIDFGESQLLLLCAQDEDSVLFTGDKRSLASLCASAPLHDIVSAISGRVYCVEQVVLKVIDKYGFDPVKDRAILGIESDTAMKAAFGAGSLAVRSNTVRTLQAYVTDLRKRARNLLADSQN